MVYIYALKCQQNKYYIGKTNNPMVRLESHSNANGCAWTKMYKPIELVALIPDCDDYDEDKYTRKYMDKYGIDNVRGGSFVSMKLEQSELDLLTKMSNGTNDNCFKCSKPGHFAKYCKETTSTTRTIVCQIGSVSDDEEDQYEDGELMEVWLCNYCGKEFTSKKGALFHSNVHCKKKHGQTNSKSNTSYYYDDDDDDEDYYCNSSNTCYKCGRRGHYANNCYASRHVKGYSLS